MEFDTVAAFQEFVNGLDDKEIQGWKSTDWVEMYDALNGALVYDSSLDERIIKLIDEKVAQKKWPPEVGEGAKHPQSKEDLEMLYSAAQQVFMDDKEMSACLVKLYKNYRFEEEDLKIMAEYGRAIGKKLAERRVDLAQAHVVNFNREDMRVKIGEAADKTVYDMTNYATVTHNPENCDERVGYETVGSEVKVTADAEMDGNSGIVKRLNAYSSTIEITDKIEFDETLATAVHEGIHAHAQIKTAFQGYEKMCGILPKDNMSTGFFDVMEYNHSFYYSYAKKGNEKRTSLENKEQYSAYVKQPVEKMAEFIGVTAERTFREETHQLSERVAQDMALLMPDLPMHVMYLENEGRVALFYDAAQLGECGKSVEALKNTGFKDVDEEAFKEIDVIIDDGLLVMKTPQSYGARLSIEKAKQVRIKKVQDEEKVEAAKMMLNAVRQGR